MRERAVPEPLHEGSTSAPLTSLQQPMPMSHGSHARTSDADDAYQFPWRSLRLVRPPTSHHSESCRVCRELVKMGETLTLT